MWAPDQSALAMLDLSGPFTGSSYRRAVEQTLHGWTDASFGARAADGTQAAIALLNGRGGVESMPPSVYGEIAASRTLATREEWSLLLAAREACGAKRLVVRSLGSPDEMPHRRFIGNASIVHFAPDTTPTDRYARLALRSLRRARNAGASAVRSMSVEPFFELYRAASSNWAMRYPEELLSRLVSDGIARLDLVFLESRSISGMLTVIGKSHWMCWLAAQNAVGRDLAASYLLYDAVLSDACAAGVGFVNLGASVGGGAQFKHHLGARESPMYEIDVSPAAARTFSAASGVFRRALRSRLIPRRGLR
jgi:hypothetical protein